MDVMMERDDDDMPGEWPVFQWPDSHEALVEDRILERTIRPQGTRRLVRIEHLGALPRAPWSPEHLVVAARP